MRLWLAALMVFVWGCNCGGTAVGDHDGGTSGGVGGGGGAGAGGGGGGTSQDGDGGFSRDAACAVIDQQATLGKKPVDVIFVIDNSVSMTAVIIGVQNNINQNFAQIIANSGLDYRVIMVSRHGSATAGQSICVSAPLSGAQSCNPPPATPQNTSRFFHYSVEIGSTNAYRQLLATYNAADEFNLAPQGWSQWLRADATKTFFVITDDNETMTAQQFDTQLLSRTPQMFGDAGSRNYVWHSIIGIAPKANPAEAYQPNEPIVSQLCTLPDGGAGGAVNNGANYQPLSIMTGGLRFPVCNPDLYGTVFRKVAEGVVAGAQISCEFAIPPPPAGWSLSNRIIVEYTPGGGGPVQQFQQVANAGACASKSFYTENGRVHLCPEACATVKGDGAAKLSVLFTCEPSGIN